MSEPTSEGARLIIEPADASSAEVAGLLASYLGDLLDIFGYDPSNAVPADAVDFTPPNGAFLVVRDSGGTATGCGGVRLLDPMTAEIKRMWLDRALRGQGAGRRLLAALEAAAVELGASRCVLDTNAALATAIALYRRAGWVDVPAYNTNPEATHWFAKDLGADSAAILGL